MDRTEERILEFALDGITKELQILDNTIGDDRVSYKLLHEFYLEIFDKYEKEVEKNTL